MVEFQSPHGSDLSSIERALSTFLSDVLNKFELNNNWSECIKFNLREDFIECETKEDRALRFEALPHRPDDRSTVVDIYLQFAMRIKVKEVNQNRRYCLESSSTEIVYLGNSDKKRHDQKRLQGVKFDYDLSPNDVGNDNEKSGINHPVFHAQYDPTCIDSNALGNVSNEHEYRPTFPRIPCAPMDLVSVVFTLLNDHRPSIVTDARGWPSSVSHESLPVFPSEAFKHVLQTDNETTTSESWYHAPVPTDMAPDLLHENHRPG